jgi:hypothetical protein
VSNVAAGEDPFGGSNAFLDGESGFEDSEEERLKQCSKECYSRQL